MDFSTSSFRMRECALALSCINFSLNSVLLNIQIMSLSLTTDWSKIRYITFLIFSISALLASTVATGLATSGKHKRQLFRENLLPQQGGKIPDEAFNPERIVLNKYNQNGFFVADGYHLEQRHPTHHNPKTFLPNTLKIYGRPDGRFVAPAGRIHNPHTVDTTYLIREPVNYIIYPVVYQRQPTLPYLPYGSLQLVRYFKSNRVPVENPMPYWEGVPHESQNFASQVFKELGPYLQKLHSLSPD